MNKQKHFYLIRGLVREALHWHDFPDLLKKLFPDSKISMIDIPGAGEYHTHPSPLSVDKMVEVMHQKYLQLQSNGDESILVAVSLGGMIGCSWMKSHPEDFKHAIFINTSFGGYSPVHHRMKPSALLHLMKLVMMSPLEKEAHILKLVSNNPLRFEETLDLWEKVRKERPVSLPNTIRQLLAAATFDVADFHPNIPVYLLGSTNDRMVSVNCSRMIAKKWQVPLVEHPEGGHDLTSDYPEWVAQEIKKLLPL